MVYRYGLIQNFDNKLYDWKYCEDFIMEKDLVLHLNKHFNEKSKKMCPNIENGTHEKKTVGFDVTVIRSKSKLS